MDTVTWAGASLAALRSQEQFTIVSGSFISAFSTATESHSKAAMHPYAVTFLLFNARTEFLGGCLSNKAFEDTFIFLFLLLFRDLRTACKEWDGFTVL